MRLHDECVRRTDELPVAMEPTDDPDYWLVVAIMATVLTLGTGALFWFARRAARGKSKLALLPEEQRVTDIFVETKQVSWGGLTLFGSPWEAS
jgi:hypothetical protein